MAKATQQTQPNLIRVCADGMDGGEISGLAYTMFDAVPIAFSDTWDLLRRCDRFFDWIDYPQPALTRRHFGPAARTPAADPQQVATEQQLLQHVGRALTFFLAVDTRRAATWQGRVILPDRELHFSSELELYRKLKALSHAHISAEDKKE